MNRTCAFCGAAFDVAKASGGACPACDAWDPDDDVNHEAALAFLRKQGPAAEHEDSDSGAPPASSGDHDDPVTT